MRACGFSRISSEEVRGARTHVTRWAENEKAGEVLKTRVNERRVMEQILAHRPWLNDRVQCRLQQLSDQLGSLDVDNTQSLLDRLVLGNQMIHEQEAVNLNPATNVMNPKAENMLSANLGSRPSLGYPGDKYEMGLEAIEGIEYVANQLVANVFDARYVETRVASGAMANLYSYMATCNPGDTIIIPPLSIGGHATHQIGGAAGLYGLNIVTAPVNALDYTIDTDGLRRLTREVRPKVITVGSSLNLWHHPVEKVREIADEVGAYVLFDAAHLCGVIAGGVWPNPLKRGAHLMGFSTYKSLGGPPNGILLTDTPNLAESIEEIAYPGLTANFDVAKSAALAVTMLDWLSFGSEYAQAMVQVSTRLAQELVACR